MINNRYKIVELLSFNRNPSFTNKVTDNVHVNNSKCCVNVRETVPCLFHLPGPASCLSQQPLAVFHLHHTAPNWMCMAPTDVILEGSV